MASTYRARLARLLRLPVVLFLMTCVSDQPIGPNYSLSRLNSADITPPAVALTAPVEGDTLTSPTAVTADASDDVLLAGVEFFLDGVSLELEDAASPYETVLNTDTLPAGDFALSALARDTAGNTMTSSIINVVVFHPDTTPPTATITAPASGSTITTPTTVSADASDDFQLAGVQFQLDGVSLGDEDLSAPYEALLNTDTIPDGAYDLMAVARDTAGNIATSELVNVTVFHPDVTFPTVAITAPLTGAFVSGIVAITADATDDVGVAGVQFRLNGADVGAEDVAPPYAIDLETDPLVDGPIELTGVARDNSGNTTLSSVVTVTVFHPDVTPPAVAITAPEDGDTVTVSMTVTADASDDGLVAAVQFKLNGVDLGSEDIAAPYETQLNIDTLTDGAFGLTAQARDTANNSTLSAVVSITVFHPDITRPTVAITAPLDGATITAPTTITADASDDRMMAGVQFKLNGVNQGPEDATAPYQAQLNTDTLPNGPVDLTAVARDTADNTATSAVVRVTVFHPDELPPTVVITSPTAGTSVAGVITVTANAADNTEVAGVQFKAGGVNFGAEDVSSPYSAQLDTYTLAIGPISLTALARDTAGNTALSPAVDVTVNNPPPKSVVVIIADDMRFDHLQYMPLTMALLGPQSVVFSNAVASTPLCCPSRASILTGRYAHNHGVLTNAAPKGGATKFNPTSTIATWLRGAGWRTGLMGKYMNEYQLLSPAIPPGWDRFEALVLSTSSPYFNYDVNENGTVRTYGTGTQNYSTTVFADKSVGFINSTPANQSLMLFYTPYAPHAPAIPHPNDVGRFATFPKWRPPSYNEAVVTDKTNLVKKTPRFTTAQINSSDALHKKQLESLQAVDRAVVQIVSALQQQNRWDNTLLMFLSDNGYSWGENRMLDRKSCPYEACIRIPMLVRMPGVSGRTESKLVSNVDLAPTIAAWAGLTPPSPINGRNLIDLINNPATPWRTEVLIEQLGLSPTYVNFFSVRNDRYIYTEYNGGEKELYDLQVDPYQLTNFINNSSYSAIKASLAALLQQLKSS